MSCRIGIDVGGTFIDFVLIDGGETVAYKEPSRRDDPAAAVLRGLAGLMERAGRDLGDVTQIVHGTTLALNAILERRLADVGLVVSQGFGDMMVLGRGGLPNAFSYKDPKRTPVVPRRNVYEIPARIRPDGSAVMTPSEADIARVADAIAADALAAVAVVVVNSYAHPAMESALAAALRERLGEVLVTASAELWPEMREFERALVAVLNAAIHPMMSRYYGRLESELAANGFAGRLAIATSTGGTVGVATARERPVETLLSGPAAGVAAAARLCEAGPGGPLDAITVDMGGTSSDMSITLGGRPEFTTETRIGDYPVIVPAIAVWAIGAGGGSILWVDAQGLLKVGPQSAGAVPGPVAYGQGGTEPTVTDCYLALGYIDPAHFLGGRMALDREAARAALAALGARIGIAGPDAAERTAAAALAIATAKMGSEIGKGLASRGLDPARFVLLPYGGAGPTHAAMLAEACGIDAILVPPAPGTFCALGTVTADLRRDFARSRRVTVGRDADAARAVRETLAALGDLANGWLGEEGIAPSAARLEVFADMQYPRTATELTVPIPAAIAQGGDDDAFASLFHAEHERRYGFRDAASPVDVTTLRLVATVPQTGAGAAPGVTAALPETTRALMWNGAELVARVCGLPAPADGPIAGPAVVEMEDSTVIVPPGWQARREATGALRLTRGADEEAGA